MRALSVIQALYILVSRQTAQVPRYHPGAYQGPSVPMKFPSSIAAPTSQLLRFQGVRFSELNSSLAFESSTYAIIPPMWHVVVSPTSIPMYGKLNSIGSALPILAQQGVPAYFE